MRLNVFEGARRILRLAQVLCVLVAGAFVFASMPTVRTEYHTASPNNPFEKSPLDFYCGADSATEFEYRTTPSGTNVGVSLCFMAFKYSDKWLVPFGIEGEDFHVADNYSPQVTSYTSARVKEFVLPEAAAAELDMQWWDEFLQNLKYAALGAVISCVVLSLLAFVVGWIVRGFAGIPMRQDSRES